MSILHVTSFLHQVAIFMHDYTELRVQWLFSCPYHKHHNVLGIILISVSKINHKNSVGGIILTVATIQRFHLKYQPECCLRTEQTRETASYRGHKLFTFQPKIQRKLSLAYGQVSRANMYHTCILECNKCERLIIRLSALKSL